MSHPLASVRHPTGRGGVGRYPFPMNGFRMGCWAVLVSAGLAGSATASPAALTAVGEAFELGVPQRLVRGVALVKLHDVAPESFLFPRQAARNKAVLEGIAQRTGVRLSFERPGVFGWSLFSIRDAAAPSARPMPTEDETEALVARVAQDRAVGGAAVDGWRTKQATPNDQYFSEQWHYSIINATTGWDLTTGSSTQRVAVIDSGMVRAHQDLAAKDAAGFDFVSDANRSNDGDGRDSDYDDAGDAGDCGFGYEPASYHGTHVSGTVAASTNNGVGVAGVNWNAQIVTVRALGVCGGDDFDLISGTAWAAGYQINGVANISATDRARVLNLSVGGDGNCPASWQDVINQMTGDGNFFVVAAGNESSDVDAPGNCNNVITVAAFGPSGDIASYSNTGPEVEVFGPGGDNDGAVASTIGPGIADYTFQAGTSMATPHVAGVVSLMLDLNPGLSMNDIVGALDSGVTCGGCNNVPALQMDLALSEVSGIVIEPEPEPSVPGDDVYEENDTFSTATPLPCNTSLPNLHASPQDFDIFSINQPAGVDVTVNLTTDANTDLDLYVVKGMSFPDDILAAAETASGNETLAYTTTGTAIAYLVNPWFDEQNGDYNDGDYGLSITCNGNVVEPEPSPEPEPGVGVEPEPEPEQPSLSDPNLDDAYEPNDDANDAALLECGQELELSLHDDQDWFVVPVQDGTTLQVTSEAFGPDAAFEIRNADGSLLVQASEPGSDPGLQVASVDRLSAGSYAVVVKPGGQNELYALRAYCLMPDEEDPGMCSHQRTPRGLPRGLWVLGLLLVVARPRRRRA